MRKKRFLLFIGCGGLLCISIIGILGLISVITPSSEEGEKKKLADKATEITVIEYQSTATNTPEPSMPPTPTQTPALINTSTPYLPPTASQTTIALNIPQCIQPDQIETEALVTNIIDGDTIEVDVNGTTYKVRYIGMDTPELTNPPEEYGQEAADKNKELVLGKTVVMFKDVSEMDRFDRLLRYVLVGDVFVNSELVRLGYAKSISYPPDVACDAIFADAEKEARKNLIGLWALVLDTRSGNATPLPITASNQVVISYIFYNGVVDRVESDEYAEITNEGDSIVQLQEWRLNAGAPGQDFIFPNFELQPGQFCRIYTDEAHPDSCGFNMQSHQPVWNNKADCGYLFDPAGEEVSKYCY